MGRQLARGTFGEGSRCFAGQTLDPGPGELMTQAQVQARGRIASPGQGVGAQQ